MFINTGLFMISPHLASYTINTQIIPEMKAGIHNIKVGDFKRNSL